jgi:hypothetical protein
MKRDKETKQNKAKYSYDEPEKYAIKIKENKTSIKHHFVVPWELIDTDDNTNKIK